MPVEMLSPPMLAEDAGNWSLLNNVHPESWINPRPADRYNLAILGGGYAGILTALEAVKTGARVALIERNLLGGVCLNAGCISSKAMIRTSRLYAEIAPVS
jgi:cation diffusion facilitator CzcD-associated flavoprotein CzcO